MQMTLRQSTATAGWRRLLLCACAAATIAVPSRAATVQDPVLFGNINGVNVAGIGNYGSGSSTLIVTTLPGVSLTAHTNNGDVSVVFDYYFNITGGNFGDNVPLSVDGLVRVNTAGGDGSDVTDAFASFAISFANGNHGATRFVSCGNVLRGAACGSDSWAGTLSAIGWVGYANLVELSVQVGVSGSGFADAYADPHVFIDPAFLAANPGYGLEFSPVTGNSLAETGAPEPSSWLLVAGALAGAVLLRRRRTVR